MLARFTDNGGATEAYYQRFATTLGYTIDLHRFRPMQVGDRAESLLFDEHWLGAWRVDVTSGRLDLATLICELQARAPAHTAVSFIDLRPTNNDFAGDIQ